MNYRIIREILNTVITILFSYLLFGFIGILISFMPDIMLIFLISDIINGKNKNRLTNKKLQLHLFLHSITFIIIMFVVFIIVFIFNIWLYLIILRICIIFTIHIVLDYMTHRKSDNKYFIGYYIFYPYKRFRILL